ncbi:hypothetical protein O181_073392 [Austropuccinia psidii MF-1]|uniref:Reverse transcriptase Ty1/copia-type domain-containing protein n=1 Tax=Austropuccinia psidii MF-1 TaxID=1389203 RepID=A0A9Q3F8Y4_9BASI|nr:hypothetical protein [Austropuccinia psidii MF-1]
MVTNTTDDEDVILSEVVPVINDMTNPAERDKWKEAVAKEFNSLVSKNTGNLVLEPSNEKIIGGMWNLTPKKNEFNETKKLLIEVGVLLKPPRTHDTLLSHLFISRNNDSVKILLLLAINCDYHVCCQFDIETEFLYGAINTSIYVSKVANF